MQFITSLRRLFKPMTLPIKVTLMHCKNYLVLSDRCVMYADISGCVVWLVWSKIKFVQMHGLHVCT
jgi:hypothetical protein